MGFGYKEGGLEYTHHVNKMKNNNYFDYNMNCSLDNTKFEVNNWAKSKNVEKIFGESRKDITIWLTPKGEISYRIYYDGEIFTEPFAKVNFILGIIFNRNIVINNSLRSSEEENSSVKMNLYRDDIALVLKEIFMPYCNRKYKGIYTPFADEFYEIVREFILLSNGNVDKEMNIYVRNTFKPTRYLMENSSQVKKDKSIILQYLFYLSNYEQDKFDFIIEWLAMFFKNLKNKNKKSLVLVGSKKSGKEILFNDIIIPLFGKEYCVKINNDVLETKNLSSIVKNKLFYNFDSISDDNLKNKNRRILKGLVEKDSIDLNSDENKIEETKIYGQTIITVDEKLEIEFDKEHYFVCKVPENIEQIYIKDIPRNEEITDIFKFKDEIELDLMNFSAILKTYDSKIKKIEFDGIEDDRKLLLKSKEENLRKFVEAIQQINKEYFEILKEKSVDLYDEVIKDFESKKIKQKNLLKIFTILHDKEKAFNPKSFMIKLREIDKDFFAQNKIIGGTGGLKYFLI